MGTMHCWALVTLLGAVYVAAPHADEAPPAAVIADASYGQTGHERCCMDIYTPREGAANGAGVLLIHGGGWSSGDKTRWRALATYLAERGYVCASVGYRLLPEHLFPTQIEDVRSAMAAFMDRADELGFDPGRVGVVGSSAGGQLAALLATIGPDDALGAGEGLTRRDTRPAAAVLYNAVLDFTDDPDRAARYEGLFGGPLEEKRALYEQASPARRVDDAFPPVLMLYGTQDTLTPVTTAFPMAERLHELGVLCEIAVFPGQEHGFGYGLGNAEQRRAAETAAAFLDRYLTLKP